MSLLKKLFIKLNKSYTKVEQSNKAPNQLKSENKWLNPKDNFGVLERGKAWSKD